MPRILKKQKKQPSPLQEVFSSIHGNCIRSHAFYKMSKTCWVPGGEGETVTKTLVENNNNKKEIFTTFSRKDKGFKNKHLDLYFLEPMAVFTVFSLLTEQKYLYSAFKTQSTKMVFKLLHKCTVK